MPEPARPLLTFAIPTFNRGSYLAQLLEALDPQVRGEPAIELLVADNASTDGTAELLAEFAARGLPVRVLRGETNVGSDANFLRCMEEARGRFVWIFGDDDLVAPDALTRLLPVLRAADSVEAIDLVYLSSAGFSSDRPALAAGALRDRLGRFAEVVTDGAYLLNKVNALIGLISVVIVNRDRLMQVPHAPLASLAGTNLMQAGWIFPLVGERCRVLYVWERLVLYRSHNSGGWGISEVFGVRLERIAKQTFADRPRLARALMNGVLRYWMMDSIMLARRGRERGMVAEPFARLLRPAFGGNWRFWVFCWPVATWPLLLARGTHGVLRRVNRLWRVVEGVARHLLRRGDLVLPAARVEVTRREGEVARNGVR